MTTVGYGDFYPVGNLGRVIASLACVYGIIFLALVVTCITDNLGLNGGEASIINVVREDTLRRHQARCSPLTALATPPDQPKWSAFAPPRPRPVSFR